MIWILPYLLFSKASDLYLRLDERKQAILLQILAKRIIVNSQGEIIDQELNSPFAYLRSLVKDFPNQEPCGSDHVRSSSQTSIQKGVVFQYSVYSGYYSETFDFFSSNLGLVLNLIYLFLNPCMNCFSGQSTPVHLIRQVTCIF